MKKKDSFVRKNDNIKARTVRVVRDSEQLGIMPIESAKRLARDAGLDLVEISAQAKPPVCRIMDFGKYKFDQKVKEKEQRKKMRESRNQIKELRLRPGIGDHDVVTKMNHARKFLSEGKKVQFNLIYKGRRELCHKEEGFKVIERIISDMEDVSTVEKYPKFEGYRLTCRLTPKN